MLGKFELVSGRNQFNTIVNLYAVNEQLAAIFADAGDYNLSIQHLMLALTQSPHWDIGADNLLLVLVQYLDKMDRLADAYAVVAALRASRQLLEANSLSIAKLYKSYVWECIILTRMEHYAESLAAGMELQKRLDVVFQQFKINQKTIYIDRLRTTGDRKLLTDIFSYVWDLFTAPRGKLSNISNATDEGASYECKAQKELEEHNLSGYVRDRQLFPAQKKRPTAAEGCLTRLAS